MPSLVDISLFLEMANSDSWGPDKRFCPHLFWRTNVDKTFYHSLKCISSASRSNIVPAFLTKFNVRPVCRGRITRSNQFPNREFFKSTAWEADCCIDSDAETTRFRGRASLPVVVSTPFLAYSGSGQYHDCDRLAHANTEGDVGSVPQTSIWWRDHSRWGFCWDGWRNPTVSSFYFPLSVIPLLCSFSVLIGDPMNKTVESVDS